MSKQSIGLLMFFAGIAASVFAVVNSLIEWSNDLPYSWKSYAGFPACIMEMAGACLFHKYDSPVTSEGKSELKRSEA